MKTIISPIVLIKVITKARKAKDTEAKTGPKILVTVNINKVTPSESVVERLNLKDNLFNFSVIDMEDGEGEKMYVRVVAEEGYKVGKNKSCSAPDLVRQAIEHFASEGANDREFYMDEENNTRSFNLGVNFAKAIHLFEDEEGNSFESQEAADAQGEGESHVVTYYPLTFLGNVIRVAGEEEEEEEETEEEVTPKRGRGRKAE